MDVEKAISDYIEEAEAQIAAAQEKLKGALQQRDRLLNRYEITPKELHDVEGLLKVAKRNLDTMRQLLDRQSKLVNGKRSKEE